MAPNWMSKEEIARDTAAFTKMEHALAGIYFWEFCVSLDFEWSFIRGRRRFNWPLVMYFGGRYLTLFTLIGLVISLDVVTEVDCQALYTFLAVGGQAMIAFASSNLAIRAMAIWGQKPIVVVSLSLLIAGHWAIVMQGVVVRAYWEPDQGCVVSEVKNTIVSATFIYSICFDSIVFLLSAGKLLFPRRRSRLVQVMLGDGLVYFLVATLANIPAAVFIALRLNPVMNVIFSMPAAVISTIAASRAVRHLLSLTNDINRSMHDGARSELMFRSNSASAPGNITLTTEAIMSQGVHIQMDTYTSAEDTHSDFARSKFDAESLTPKGQGL